jgi:hypothetical protein
MGINYSPHVVSIHILDDVSLLNIFYLYRPFFLGEDEDSKRILGGWGLWKRGRWWYSLAHVCQRWRNLILGSASHLRLSLVCTNGTPVQNMLTHSPPLPLTVDYSSNDGITTEDEEGVLLALEQRHRIRHLRLIFPAQSLRKLVMAIDEEFPILEYLIVGPPRSPVGDGIALMLPETLQAPNLHHFTLTCFSCPIQPRLHPIAASLVTLYLVITHQSAYFQPNVLLQWISSMPQLEILGILFSFPVPNRDVERQLTHTPVTTHITLPVLRLFWFQGVSAYLEALVCRITTPRLEDLRIQLFKQLTFSVPRLAQFMNTTTNLRFNNVVIMFKDKQINVSMVSRGGGMYAFGVTVGCEHLDWQVSSMVQVSNALSQVFSAVGLLTLRHDVHGQSSEEHNDVDRIEWRNLLRPFSNVKTLVVEDGLVEQLSRCLRLEDGELPLELLPELQDLTYFGSGDAGDAFTPFIDARRDAGRPVSLVRRDPGPGPGPSVSAPAITTASGEAGNNIDT